MLEPLDLPRLAGRLSLRSAETGSFRMLAAFTGCGYSCEHGDEMDGTRIWRGRVNPEHRDEHETFVAWLNTDEARVQYAKFLLNGYTLAQQGDDLTVAMTASEPPPIIRFLRNSRMWPDYWEYISAGSGSDELPEDAVRVRWRRGDGA
jgi:hypothetical protein